MKKPKLSRPSRLPRSIDELRAGKAHLAHEFHTFTAALAGIINAQKQPPDLPSLTLWTHAGKALVDSMAIHARSLIHFAYPEGQVHADDILAEDYVPDWDAKCPPWPAELKSVRSRVATEVAHLSYKRLPLTPEEVGTWPLVTLVSAFGEVFGVFNANLPVDLKDPPDPDAELRRKLLSGPTPMVGIPRWPAT
jgi:hypothetical protein